MQHTLLYAFVQNRCGLAVLSRRRGMITPRDRLTQLAQGSTQLALIRTVNRRLSNRLTCALQRRNMICHKLSSLNPYICRGKWDAGLTSQSSARPILQSVRPHSLQYLSLRNSSRQVNHRLSRSPVKYYPALPRLRPDSPPVTIHNLALDAKPSTFYSLPIFDALAPPANPVPVKKAHPLRCNQSPASSHPIPPVVVALNPASPDGGQ